MANDFTYCGANGCSVIDYVLSTPDIFPYFHKFIVCSFNTYSDHAPLHIELKARMKVDIANEQSDSNDNDVKYVKYRWNSDLSNESKEFLEQNIHCLQKCIDENDMAMNEGLENCVKSFVNELSTLMSSYHKSPMGKKRLDVDNRNISNLEAKHSQPWFNDECKRLYAVYKKALSGFNRNKSVENHETLHACKSQYKMYEKRTKRKYLYEDGNMLESIRKSNPKLFFSRFARKKANRVDASLSDLHEHFKSLAGVLNDNIDDDNSDDNAVIYEELDVDITMKEIENAIQCLKKGKSHGLDGIINEYFIEFKDILLPFLHSIFNAMYNTGYFPNTLCDALIVPIYKKGNTADPGNYRGISLLSCMTKLFTSILNKRLISWAENNDVITDAQFGFKPLHSTVDAIFALQTIVNNYLSNKTRLYCCFVDFKRAFDTVDRVKMWQKISKLGIRGKALKIIQSLYSNVKSSVLLNGKLSDFFDNNIGVLQGEIISPLLFSLYVNDCEVDFISSGIAPIELQELSLFLLMYADDMVVFSESASGLQFLLNSLVMYTDKWSLSVNVNKTKCMVFRNGGVLRAEDEWFYMNEKIEVVDKFCYLSLLLNYNGKFQVTQKQ